MLLDPAAEHLTMREILKDSGGDGATKKLAKRKLESAGFINAFCTNGEGLTSTAAVYRARRCLQMQHQCFDMCLVGGYLVATQRRV